jgi:anhydro-N-acetylmuramic acid kinase
MFAKCHRELGLFAADSLEDFLRSESLSAPGLVGFHGQSIYHEPSSDDTVTLQIGDPSPICARFNVPVVSDLRSMDTAVHGQGAPIVSIVDYLKYRSEDKTRAILNIGGISNFTVLPRSCDLNGVLGLDVGPGNILIDAAVERLTNSKMKYDSGGQMASHGKISKQLFDYIMQVDDYRLLPYPKTTGRERYGRELVELILNKAQALNLSKEDTVTTITYYTAFMISYHLKQLKEKGLKVNELIVGGGGSKNKYLIQCLKEASERLDVEFHAKYGVPSDFWECYAFAMLAYLSYSGYPGNVPSVTGASRQVLLGRINLPVSHNLK